jgi:putative DNA methylase
MTYDYIRTEGQAGRMGAKLMAIVAEGERGRLYLPPTAEMEAVVHKAKPEWKPETPLHGKCRVNVSNYGFDNYGDLFTSRQLVALTTFSDLVQEAREKVKKDAESSFGCHAELVSASHGKGKDETLKQVQGDRNESATQVQSDGSGQGEIAAPSARNDNNTPLYDGGTGATAYAEAVTVYLAFSIDKAADYWSTICTWHSSKELIRNTFGRQAIPMTWDYVETNIFSDSSGNVSSGIEWAQKALCMFPAVARGFAAQGDAQNQSVSTSKVVSTDPPYYDNIGYADLSDFFYVWLRRSIRTVFPNLFATMAVPKAEELVATPYRHGNKEKAKQFFLNGMTQAMHRLAEQAHAAFPVTIYYAFKQSESDSDEATTNTGWDTFLAAVIEAGFSISGTWPMRTELSNRMIGSGANALASSIVLVCHPRPLNAPTATRSDFFNALKIELPLAIAHLQRGNIAPVDLAQSAIGPGMAVYTRYAKVLDAAGNPLSVREALALINQTLDEVLAEQEGDFDADTRWALAWFEQHGFGEGQFGVAETLSKAKNTSVSGMVGAGILESKAGRVCLLKPSELPADWDPTTDSRLTVWEMVHHLIRVLEAGGEGAAAELVAKLGSKAEVVRELAYRLYTICERKKRAQEALSYNALVQSWPEIVRLARESGSSQEKEQVLF